MKGLEDGAPCSSLLLPHEMFASFFQKAGAWQSSIVPDATKLTTFWNNFEGHPCFQGHPLRSLPNYKSSTIPLAMHGDECLVLGWRKIWCKCVLFSAGFL